MLDANISQGSMGEVNENNTLVSGLNQSLDIDCGLMSEEIENTYMSCSFWMEGVLIICTSKKFLEYLSFYKKLLNFYTVYQYITSQ